MDREIVDGKDWDLTLLRRGGGIGGRGGRGYGGGRGRIDGRVRGRDGRRKSEMKGRAVLVRGRADGLLDDWRVLTTLRRCDELCRTHVGEEARGLYRK